MKRAWVTDREEHCDGDMAAGQISLRFSSPLWIQTPQLWTSEVKYDHLSFVSQKLSSPLCRHSNTKYTSTIMVIIPSGTWHITENIINLSFTVSQFVTSQADLNFPILRDHHCVLMVGRMWGDITWKCKSYNLKVNTVFKRSEASSGSKHTGLLGAGKLSFYCLYFQTPKVKYFNLPVTRYEMFYYPTRCF